jgi:hypothetical protein
MGWGLNSVSTEVELMKIELHNVDFNSVSQPIVYTMLGDVFVLLSDCQLVKYKNMSYQILSQTEIKKSKKEHECSSCEAILQNWSFNQLCDEFILSFSEKRSLVKAKQNNYKIQIGEFYVRQNAVFDGDFCTHALIP